MNTKNLIAAIAILAGTSSAFAAEWADFSDFQSTKTRAEVTAELKDAQAQGTYVTGGQEFTAPDAQFASTTTRAQVLAKLKQAQKDGSYALAQQEFDDQYRGMHSGGDTASRLARNGNVANVN